LRERAARSSSAATEAGRSVTAFGPHSRRDAECPLNGPVSKPSCCRAECRNKTRARRRFLPAPRQASPRSPAPYKLPDSRGCVEGDLRWARDNRPRVIRPTSKRRAPRASGGPARLRLGRQSGPAVVPSKRRVSSAGRKKAGFARDQGVQRRAGGPPTAFGVGGLARCAPGVAGSGVSLWFTGLGSGPPCLVG